MNIRIFWRRLIAVVLLAGAGAAAAAAPAAPARGTTCHMPGFSQPLRCLTINVPLDYKKPEGEKLALFVTLAPAFRESARGDPLIVLAGGPGQAGSDVLQLLDNTFRNVRATRDIVFIDQRGTGRSGKLDCDSTRSLEGKPEAEQDRIIGECLAGLARPYALFNTENAARDIEQVRLAMQYPSVNVWGASYGTRLAQAYARLFPAPLRSLILDGVAPPEQIIFAWGRDAQSSLDAVFARCAADPGCKAAFPQLPQQFATLLERVRAGAVKLDFPHPRTALPTHLQMAPEEFLETVRVALYSANAGTRLPYLIDSAAKGNWAPFLVQLYAPGDFKIGGMATGLTLSVTCAEDIPRLTPAILADEEKNSFLGGATLKRFPELCKFVRVPAIPFVAPGRIRAPVLLFSGALDPVTPPHRAAAAAATMDHAQQLVVKNLGHGVSMVGCAPRLMREFLDAPEAKVEAKCLEEISAPSFQLGAAGPQP